MTRENKRFERNQDGEATTHTGDDMGSGDFRTFARWVNNPVSAYAKHNVPDDLREAIDDVDDAGTRRYLKAVVESFEDAQLSPREFVRIIDYTDGIDHFDPLSVPEGWGSDVEDRPTPARLDDLAVGDPCPSCLNGSLIKGVDGDPLEPPNPWCDECGWVVGDDVVVLPEGFDARPGLDDHPEDGLVWAVVVGVGIVLVIVAVVYLL